MFLHVYSSGRLAQSFARGTRGPTLHLEMLLAGVGLCWGFNSAISAVSVVPASPYPGGTGLEL